MGKTHVLVLAFLGLAIAAGWLITERIRGPEPDEPAGGTGIVGGPAAPTFGDRTPPADTILRGDVAYTDEDVEIFGRTMAWAAENQLDTLPVGEVIVRLGRRFVGEPYVAQPLELPGEERVVVNLRGFDCVTYVESVLAMARMIRDGRDDFGTFTNELRRIRYRDGELDGYLSRLHYFSEWIADNEELGLVEDRTASLGGRPWEERIDFMSTHAEAYPHLDGQPERIERIRQIEQRLSQRTRFWIPQDEIPAAVDEIQDGDVIAATSSVEGLDVAHTGFALWLDGRLHLMHAPLVDRPLEISEEPLAVRILGIDGQDGIMVARPR